MYSGYTPNAVEQIHAAFSIDALKRACPLRGQFLYNPHNHIPHSLSMQISDSVRYDPFTFRKHLKNIGRAYREQATTLIEICRLYVEAAPKTYTEDDRLRK